MLNLVSMMKNKSITFPSGVVETFTFSIRSSSSQRTHVTSTKKTTLSNLETDMTSKTKGTKGGDKENNIPQFALFFPPWGNGGFYI